MSVWGFGFPCRHGTLNIVLLALHYGRTKNSLTRGKNEHSSVNLKNYHFASTTCHGCVDFQMREHTKCVVLQQFQLRPTALSLSPRICTKCSLLKKKRCSTPAHNIFLPLRLKRPSTSLQKVPICKNASLSAKSCQASLWCVCCRRFASHAETA
jgi:hypothetical protein